MHTLSRLAAIDVRIPLFRLIKSPSKKIVSASETAIWPATRESRSLF